MGLPPRRTMQQRALHQCSRPQPFRSVPALRHPEFAMWAASIFCWHQGWQSSEAASAWFARRPSTPGDCSFRCIRLLFSSVLLDTRAAVLSHLGCSFAWAPSTAFRCRINRNSLRLSPNSSSDVFSLTPSTTAHCMLLSDGRGEQQRERHTKRLESTPSTRPLDSAERASHAQVPCSR